MWTNSLNLRWRAERTIGNYGRLFCARRPAPGGSHFPGTHADGAVSAPIRVEQRHHVLYTNTVAGTPWRGRPDAATAARLGLYDPRGTVAPLLARFGTLVHDAHQLALGGLRPVHLLVIGRDALTNEPLAEVGRDSLCARWRILPNGEAGLLVLEQTNYPAWMPAELRLQDFDASFAFPNPSTRSPKGFRRRPALVGG